MIDPYKTSPVDDTPEYAGTAAPEMGAAVEAPKPNQVQGIASGVKQPTTALGQEQGPSPVAKAVMGQLSEDADVMLAMQGVVNGDPIGMEMYDMGFFEDGTPALRINNHPIPIDMNTWMALVKMREDTRDEIKMRMERQRSIESASLALSNAIKAMPNISSETQRVLDAMKDEYPDWVKQQIERLAVNMEADGGFQQQVELGAEFQKYMGKNWTQRKTSQRKQFVPLMERAQRGLAPDQDYLVVPSELDEAKNAAREGRDLEMAGALDTAAFLAQVGGPARIGRAQKGMKTGGIFDVCFDFDNNRMTTQSMLGQLMLAASNDGFNQGDTVPIPTTMGNINEAQAYLEKLQQWASRNWGYAENDPQSVVSAAQYVLWFVNNRNSMRGNNIPANDQTAVPSPTAPSATPQPAPSAQPAQGTPRRSGQPI